MDTEDGQVFIKNLAQFVRTHEKALANALQLRRQAPKNGQSSSISSSLGVGSPAASPATPNTHNQIPSPTASTSSTLANALSLPSLNFASQNIKPAKLSLTPHHLFYLLSRFEEQSIPVGPMNVRLENIHTDTSPANYVSFLSQSQRSKGRGSDRDSIRSVSSVRSVMSGMSSLWSSFGLGASSSAAKTEKTKAAIQSDLRYLYSAFTKIPCLRLSPDRKARLIEGYEEFPFDTAVPLLSFKNLSALEITDVDFRQFYGWDRLAEQLRSLSIKRGAIDDPADLLINIVLDDMDKRRRRSSKSQGQSSPILAWAAPSPSLQQREIARSTSAPGSPNPDEKLGQSTSPQGTPMVRGGSEGSNKKSQPRPGSVSPTRPTSSRQLSSYGHVRNGGSRVKRSGSGSSNSSMQSNTPRHSGSSSNLLSLGGIPASKWRFLKHLSLADNSLTALSITGLAPLSNTLHSLDLSSNLFSEIPDSLATLTSLRALNLSNCMIESLHSLSRNPLPAISALNLRANRLVSIAGVERLFSMERLDLRDNKLTDPTELARLTGIPDIREVWVSGNPFVKTHSGYRITIFNLFRATPGYTEDIIIDSSGPGYSERRQLMDHAPERMSVPVVKPLPQDYHVSPSVSSNKATSRAMEDQEETKELKHEVKSPRTIRHEVTVGSGRRKKGPKRRIVELSRNDHPTEVQPQTSDIKQNEVDVVVPPDSAYGTSPPDTTSTLIPPVTLEPDRQRSQSQPEPPPRIDTVMSPPRPQATLPTPTAKTKASKESQDWNISGEIYKKKIEALRNEVGNGWLSVLSEEGWESQRNSQTVSPGGEFSPASTIRPSPTTPKAGSQAIVSGGRTLG
ncbi:MAG: hypothetical protein M1827_000913 [Pycnora praestabilis]|nr:MAG: hypothetical protein M1827_000913 [Pycnora praestabilis]